MWGVGFFKGLWVTLKNAARGPVTVNYPEERLELPERARWAVVPLYDDEGSLKCTACMNCVRECPDDVLALEVETDEDKNKRIVEFTWETGACMFCGLCVEKCPFSALAMSHEYELATTDPGELSTVLVHDVMAARPARKKKAAKAKDAPESDDVPKADDAPESDDVPKADDAPAPKAGGDGGE
jgi:formate hydrogenlyase subunit 6/NADH:ubiquinone oxidoreductase subunit I